MKRKGNTLMGNTIGKVIKKHLAAVAVISALCPTIVMSQTLEQAVAITLDTNPELQQAFSRFKIREEQANQAFSDYLPTIDLTADYGWRQTTSPQISSKIEDTENAQSATVGLTLRQNLFTGFFTQNEYARLTHEATAEHWQLFASAEDIALKVAKVYINYLVEKQVTDLAQRNVDKHQRLFDQIKEKTESGLGSTADLSQSKGRLARAYSNLISAKNNLADARIQYIQVVNQSPDNVIVPEADQDRIPLTLEDAIAIAKKAHPTLKSANSDIDAAHSERKSATSKYYPEISVELGGEWSNEKFDPSKTVEGDTTELKAVIQMRYNLFNGGADDARVRETAYKVDEAKGIQQETYREVVSGTTLAWNAYELLGKQKNYIRTHVEASKETQSAYEQQFRLGQRSLLDLLDSENELFDARKSYLRAEFDELIAKYRLLNATGQLLSSLHVNAPAPWDGKEDK